MTAIALPCTPLPPSPPRSQRRRFRTNSAAWSVGQRHISHSQAYIHTYIHAYTHRHISHSHAPHISRAHTHTRHHQHILTLRTPPHTHTRKWVLPRVPLAPPYPSPTRCARCCGRSATPNTQMSHSRICSAHAPSQCMRLGVDDAVR